MNSRAKTTVELALRLLLGAVLFYTGFSKIKNAWEFAEILANFDLLPPAANQILAVTLPWSEIATGLLLVFGVWTRAAALLAAAMFAAFTLAIISALVRGLDIDCGCFGTDAAAHVGLRALAIDLAGLVAAIAILLLHKPQTPATHNERLSTND